MPTAPKVRKATPTQARIMLLGQPKIGKTTLASAWNPKRTLILDFERGTDMLPGEHFVMDLKSYDEFKQAVDLIVKDHSAYDTIVIDTADALWKLTDAHAGAGRGQVAAGLVEFGKGLAEAEGLFRREVGRLLALPVGVWFTGHTELVEVNKVMRYVPTLDKRVRGYVLGACSYILFAEAQGPKRVLHTQPNERFEAGSRTPLPEPLEMDAKKLYAAIAAGLKATTPAAKANGKAKSETAPEPEAVTA
jgi:hypothetical protein